MEEVMIPYIQAYGTSEAVRQIFSFMNEQEVIIAQLLKYETDRESGI